MAKIGIVYDLHANVHGPVTRKDNYLDACIAKMDYILSHVDIAVMLGDVFEKARTEDVVKNRLLALFNKHGKAVYAIPGNHDIEKGAIEGLGSTSFGNLAFHKAFTILTPDKIWKIDGLTFGILDHRIEVAKTQEFPEIDVVIGHHAYEWGRDPSLGIEEADLQRYHAKFAFFGHDHQPYPMKIASGTQVYRCGSTLRTALRDYTENHVPSFCIIENGRVSQITLPHTPFKDAFRYEEKKEFKRCVKLVSEIKNFLASTSIEVSNQKSMEEILVHKLSIPREELDYLRLIYRATNLPF